MPAPHTAMDLFDYPASPGFKEATTSRDAAVSMKAQAPRLQDKCCQALRSGPATADEIAERIGCSILAVRPRITELHRLGKIAETGERRSNYSGRQAKVWGIVRNDHETSN